MEIRRRAPPPPAPKRRASLVEVQRRSVAQSQELLVAHPDSAIVSLSTAAAIDAALATAPPDADAATSESESSSEGEGPPPSFHADRSSITLGFSLPPEAAAPNVSLQPITSMAVLRPDALVNQVEPERDVQPLTPSAGDAVRSSLTYALNLPAEPPRRASTRPQALNAPRGATLTHNASLPPVRPAMLPSLDGMELSPSTSTSTSGSASPVTTRNAMLRKGSITDLVHRVHIGNLTLEVSLTFWFFLMISYE